MKSTPKPTSKKLAHDWMDYIRESKGLSSILVQTEELARIKSALNQILTELSLGHLTQKIESGWNSTAKNELFLLVPNASIAARLQQTLPSIINGLRKNGVLCTVIKVRLKPAPPLWQVTSKTADQSMKKPKVFSSAAIASWQSLLEKLTPGSELRKAVEKLLQGKTR